MTIYREAKMQRYLRNLRNEKNNGIRDSNIMSKDMYKRIYPTVQEQESYMAYPKYTRLTYQLDRLSRPLKRTITI